MADGEPLTAEAVRAALREACRDNGAPAPADVIVAVGLAGRSATSRAPARCPPNLPIVIDLWPRTTSPDATRT